jgi:hypothetical protein
VTVEVDIPFEADATMIKKAVAANLRARVSAAPGEIDDGGPDGRRQTVPRCDELTECLLLPAHFRPATRCHVVTAFGANVYGNRAEGAILAAYTFSGNVSIRYNRRIYTFQLDEIHDVSSQLQVAYIQQLRTAKGGSCSPRAFESAAKLSRDDAGLAVVLAIWQELQATV